MIRSAEHPTIGSVPIIEYPLNYERATTGFRSVPPLLGEDTIAVLGELGYDDEAIAGLDGSGVIPECELAGDRPMDHE